MKFEWDEHKNKINQRKHGFNFVHAKNVFENPMLTFLDTRIAYGEDRWVGIGIARGEIVTVVFTESIEQNIIRIISMRKATNYERKKYNKSPRY